MDTALAQAADALAAGDPLGALNCVALRDDAPALALRGIALAQLGDYGTAKKLVKGAARAFGGRDMVARARCVVAEAEIALAARELKWPVHTLDTARKVLEAHGDVANAAYARYLQAQRALLVGRLDDAGDALAHIDAHACSPALQALHALVMAGIAMRRLREEAARAALSRARDAAQRAGISALQADVARAAALLEQPVARLVDQGSEHVLRLGDVARLFVSDALIVDACRYVLRQSEIVVPLAGRRVLFALVRALGDAWPADVARDALIALAFRTRHPDETHRARLRVEIGRLRKAIAPLAGIRATPQGFVLAPRGEGHVVVLARPVEDKHAAVLALLAEGEAWSTLALAMALGTSQRSVQRAVDELARAGTIEPFGHGRARRWVMPLLPGFATTLLLPAPLPDA
ncbi:helix-turn-helix domain-containing protein [Pusillimonas sp. TS35]|nr:helix-turn-helix domain-containing protein [Pusillimonas sp. TS35]